jgi:hypothetical protein
MVEARGTLPQVVDRNSRVELAAAYRLLTGRALPRLEPSMLWRVATA